MKHFNIRSLYDPLNDYLFYKVMGEKNCEVQLLGFLNAVLEKTGKGKFTSVEILEDKTFAPETVGDKSVTFDIRAVLQGKTKVNVEVQLRNEYNMDKRSLFYWSKEFSESLEEGQDYSELPNVTAINIINFDYLGTKHFHSCFQLRDKYEHDILLTDALEIHFINMVRYRKHNRKKKGQSGHGVTLDDSLSRWLGWFNKSSRPELVKEITMMDTAIRAAEERLEYITRDADAKRAYDVRFKAMCDWTSAVNYHTNKGLQKGLRQGKLEIAQNLKNMGLSAEQIQAATGIRFNK